MTGYRAHDQSDGPVDRNPCRWAQQRRMMVGELRVASIPDGAPIAYNATKDPFTGAPSPAWISIPTAMGMGSRTRN